MTTRLTIGALAAGVLLTGATLGAASATDGAAPTGDAPVQVGRTGTGADTTANTTAGTTSLPDRAKVTVGHETGLVVEANSSDETSPVFVSVYENSIHGSFLQIVWGDPDDDLIGSLEQPAPLVEDGEIDVTVEIDGKPATLTGTLTSTGVTKVVDTRKDDGEQMVDRGTHTMYAADLTLAYDGRVVPLVADVAFHYDLETRSVAIGSR